jgi:hypothetical protein
MIGKPGGDLFGSEVREAVALRLVHLREHPVDAAVDVVDRDDVVAGREVHRVVVAPRPDEGMPVRRAFEEPGTLKGGSRGFATRA